MIDVLLFVLVVWLIISVLGVALTEQTKKVISILLVILIVLWFFGGQVGFGNAAWFRHPC